MKKQQKNIIMGLVIIGIIALAIGILYFANLKPKEEKMIEIDGLYDANQNLIQKGLSVIGNTEGVKYITLKITVNNKDTIPLTFNFDELTPQEIISAKPTTKLSIDSGKSSGWITGLIDVEPYENKTQSFCVKVSSEKIPSLRETSQTGGCIDITIKPNPVGSFSISLNSSIGDGSINPGCSENWQCGNWSICASGSQTRICTDLNNCGTTSNKPFLNQNCTSLTECNLANTGIKRCYSTVKYQTCLASGSWSGALSCANVCTGQGICS